MKKLNNYVTKLCKWARYNQNFKHSKVNTLILFTVNIYLYLVADLIVQLTYLHVLISSDKLLNLLSPILSFMFCFPVVMLGMRIIFKLNLKYNLNIFRY